MTIINCDMGEAFGLYRMGDDEAIMPLITVANVACGFHASDFNHMRTTVRLAKQHGVKVGAHPSLPDLQGFGRREMKMPREEIANCIIYQVGALMGQLLGVIELQNPPSVGLVVEIKDPHVERELVGHTVATPCLENRGIAHARLLV